MKWHYCASFGDVDAFSMNAKRDYSYFWINAKSFCIFFSVLRVITLQNSCGWRIHFNWKDSTADSDVAEQTGRLPPLRNARKRELESTFRDSDWPSFNNAVYAPSLFFSLLLISFSLSLPLKQQSSQTNHVKLTSKFCSGRSLDLTEQLTVGHLHVGGLPLWPLFFKAGFHFFRGNLFLFSLTPLLPTSAIYTYTFYFFDKQLPPHLSVASFSPFIFLASTPFLGHGLVEMENRPVAWYNGSCWSDTRYTAEPKKHIRQQH